MNRDIEKTIASLPKDQESFDPLLISDLSNLTRRQQELLTKVWPQIPLYKRRHMIKLMNEKADEDIQLDFSAVCMVGLNDEDAQVRHLSIKGLWECENIKLIRIFLNLLQQDPSVEVRASAASALGRFVFQGEMEYLTEALLQKIVERLVQTFNDESLSVAIRRRAIESLAYSSDSRVHAMIDRAYQDPSEEMQISAIFAMGRTSDPYWSGSVRAELFNDNPAFCFEAVRAAGELADSRSVNRIALLLVDEQQDQQIREMAAWALGEIGGPISKKVLTSVVKTKDATLRRIAQESLAEMTLLDDENFGMGFFVPDMFDDENDEEEWFEQNENGYYQDQDDEDDEYDEYDYLDSNQDWYSFPL